MRPFSSTGKHSRMAMISCTLSRKQQLCEQQGRIDDPNLRAIASSTEQGDSRRARLLPFSITSPMYQHCRNHSAHYSRSNHTPLCVVRVTRSSHQRALRHPHERTNERSISAFRFSRFSLRLPPSPSLLCCCLAAVASSSRLPALILG